MKKKKRVRNAEATRERILTAAERLFAAHGFDGVSLRAIAAEADGQLALLHYHFGSKLDLYRAIWERHHAPYDVPQVKLDDAGFDFDRPQPVVIHELVERYVRMPLTLLDKPGGVEFLMIMGREAVDPKRSKRGMMRDYWEPTAKWFRDAFQKARPELTPDQVRWGFRFMTGVVVKFNDGTEAGDMMASVPSTIEFIVGGWLRLRADANARDGKGAK